MCAIRGRIYFLCGFVYLFAACDSGPRLDNRAEAANAAKAQIAGVFAQLGVAELEFARKGISCDGLCCAQAVAEQNGRDFFRCANNNRSWLFVNPNAETWIHMDKATNDIAVFNPAKILDKSSGRASFCAITYGGRLLQLSNRPPWRPVPVWNMR